MLQEKIHLINCIASRFSLTLFPSQQSYTISGCWEVWAWALFSKWALHLSLSEAFILHSFGTHSLCFILGITVSIRLLSCRQQRMDSCNKEFIGRIFIANFLSYETQEMSRRAGRFWHQNHSMSHAAQSSVENITGTTAGCHQERILCCSWCRSRQVHLPGHA